MGYEWHDKIFTVSPGSFETLALAIFHVQQKNNPVYRDYIHAIGVDPASVDSFKKIPFLPISFFKSHQIRTGDFTPALVFESSGTTQSTSSRHFIKDISLYHSSFRKSFERFYGSPANYCILGLLPSYLEKGNSSLVYMVNKLMEASGHPESGFYLDNFKELAGILLHLESNNQKTILFGVTYALLDFAAQYSLPLVQTTIIETGGMKGRKEEITREEVHQQLRKAFGKNEIHSEYGMTELLSQAYSKGHGVFQCPPWMKILIRDEEDPFSILTEGTGAINIIDLANVHSCCFIATDDAGRLKTDGNFEVMGRLDGSDLRGCSLMAL
jgi:phenylacetate-coenzyme A ligase PaaK-like adenylate-forming protein